MKQNISPPMIAVAMIVLLVIFFGLYKMTLGASQPVAKMETPSSKSAAQKVYTNTYSQDGQYTAPNASAQHSYGNTYSQDSQQVNPPSAGAPGSMGH